MKTRLIGLLLVTLLGAAACGAAEASNGDGVAAIDTEAQLLAFAECVRSQGFEMEDPTIDADGNAQLPRGERTEGFLEARQACEQHLAGVTLGFRGSDQTELQDSLLEFAACMRDNGFDMADPDFSSADGGRGLLRNIDQDDPTYQAAFANCDDVLGGIGAGS